MRGRETILVGDDDAEMLGLTHMMLHPVPADRRHLEIIATQLAPRL